MANDLHCPDDKAAGRLGHRAADTFSSLSEGNEHADNECRTFLTPAVLKTSAEPVMAWCRLPTRRTAQGATKDHKGPAWLRRGAAVSVHAAIRASWRRAVLDGEIARGSDPCGADTGLVSETVRVDADRHRPRYASHARGLETVSMEIAVTTPPWDDVAEEGTRGKSVKRFWRADRLGYTRPRSRCRYIAPFMERLRRTMSKVNRPARRERAGKGAHQQAVMRFRSGQIQHAEPDRPKDINAPFFANSAQCVKIYANDF